MVDMDAPNISAQYDGRQEGIRSLAFPPIEVWENKYPENDYEVELSCPEFNAICPLTALPDFGTIRIVYCPDKWCAELKSFKLYLVAYRNLGIFHEHAVNRILDDFVKAARPRWAKVEMVFNPRGGITTTVNAEYKRV